MPEPKPRDGFEGHEGLWYAVCELGPVVDNGAGGFRALEFRDMGFYHQLSGVPETREDARLMVLMSRAYLRGFEDKHELSIPPVQREGSADVD